MWMFRQCARIARLLQLKRLLSEQRGAALVEFVIAIPFLVTLMIGTFEVTRYALINQKVDRISASISDLVARAEALTQSEVDNLFDAIPQLARPFDFAENGMVIVSSVTGVEGTGPVIIGQRSSGSIDGVSSIVGEKDDVANLPTVFTNDDGETLPDGESVIVAEVYYEYEPLLLGWVLGEMRIFRDSFFRPRFSESITFE